jgi:hypothetical protein
MTVVEVVEAKTVTGKWVVLVRVKSGHIKQGILLTDAKGATWELEKVGNFVPPALAAQHVFGLLLKPPDENATLDVGAELTAPE